MRLKDLFLQTRNHTEVLCSTLEIEDHVVQPVTDVSPPKWHLAHTTWFFEQFILIKHSKNYREYHPDFSFLFNSYYNNVGDRTLRQDRGYMTRPTVSEIHNYRKCVTEALSNLLEENPTEEVLKLVEIGINHEQQHQELLLSDIKFILGHNPIFPVYDNQTTLLDNETNKHSGSFKISEGIYSVGYQGEEFCFDNELGVHKVYLNDFEIEKNLITNGEYIEFINDGGYTNYNLWLDEGWTWLKQNSIKSPLYWHEVDGECMHYNLKGLHRINENDILKHVSFYEAMAFAEWKSMRLPTEFEWEIASKKLNWGQRWEWTNSAYLPYPGFEKVAGAIGEYNGKFMINQMVLRGASLATTLGHSRPTYRNFFHPDAQWQFTGIRLVK